MSRQGYQIVGRGSILIEINDNKYDINYIHNYELGQVIPEGFEQELFLPQYIKEILVRITKGIMEYNPAISMHVVFSIVIANEIISIDYYNIPKIL